MSGVEPVVYKDSPSPGSPPFAHRPQGLYRVNETRKASQPFLQRRNSGRVERPLPNLFTLFKGEFWVALHRDFCEYIHESPDNVARSLQVRHLMGGGEGGGVKFVVGILLFLTASEVSIAARYVSCISDFFSSGLLA